MIPETNGGIDRAEIRPVKQDGALYADNDIKSRLVLELPPRGAH
jgi:hypothetical protein